MTKHECRMTKEVRMIRMTNYLTVIPSEVEESRGETEEQFRGILRLRFASLI